MLQILVRNVLRSAAAAFATNTAAKCAAECAIEPTAPHQEIPPDGVMKRAKGRLAYFRRNGHDNGETDPNG